MARQGKERTLVILKADGQTSLAIADKVHVLGDKWSFDFVLEDIAKDKSPGTRPDIVGVIARLPVTQKIRELF